LNNNLEFNANQERIQLIDSFAMKILGNIIWLIFGGIFIAIEYFIEV